MEGYINNEQKYLIYLIKCAVTGTSAELPKTTLNWEYLASYAEEQQFEHILYPMLKDIPDLAIGEKTWHHLHQRYGRTVYRDSIQDMELDEICTVFSNNKIRHIPLKGSIVKRYYPLPDIRRSGDFDILIHNDDRKTAGLLLKQLGYEQESKNQVMDDSFWRNKTHLELHVMLIPPTTESHVFFDRVWTYSVQENDYTYKMQTEFLYAYLLAHLHRHLMSGGGGIKLITDFFVLENKLDINREILINYLQQAKLTNLYNCVLKLAEKWFKDEKCTDSYTLLIEKLILGGNAYGDYETSMKMKFSRDDSNEKSNKAAKLIKFAFPSAEYLKIRYPVLEKHPELLPVMWVRRLLDVENYNPKLIIKSAGDNTDKSVLKDLCEYISN